MVQGPRKPADVVHLFPPPREHRRPPLDEAPGALVPLPAKEVGHHEAAAALSSIGVMGVRPTALAELGAPQKLMLSKIEGGYEIHDLGSRRASPFSRAEPTPDWVRSFYLAVFEDGGRLLCRYLNREPGRRALGSLEQPVFDPAERAGRFSLDSFIETVIFGDPPD